MQAIREAVTEENELGFWDKEIIKAVWRVLRQSRILLYGFKLKVSLRLSYLSNMKLFLWSRWKRTILYLPWFLGFDIEMTCNSWNVLWILDNEDSHAKIEVEMFQMEKRPDQLKSLDWLVDWKTASWLLRRNLSLVVERV